MLVKCLVVISLFTIAVLFLIGCKTTRTGQAGYKYWADYYREYLHADAKLISAGPNHTVELYQGRYLAKSYYYDTKVVTGEERYADARLTTRIGPAISRTDWGSKMLESNYENGFLSGEYLRYNTAGGWLEERSAYQRGKKEGLSTQYDSSGRVNLTAHYHLDSLDGQYIRYTPDGAVKLERTYKNGKIIAGPPNEPSDPSKEIVPEYPCDPKYRDQQKCGEISLLQYLAQNARYPADARNLGIQGNAVVTFMVQKDGSVSDIRVIRGYCDSIRDECVRLVSGMSRWTPGSAYGIPVKVTYTLPIRFRLQ